MDIQSILDAIKDYGAAIISTISVGGVAAVATVVVKVKQAIDKTKETMDKVTKQKEETSAELQTAVNLVKEQNKQIEDLKNDVYKLEGEVRTNVKGNRKN